MLERKAVIDAVARKHGVILGDDDPILSFLAVHDVILDEYRDRFDQVETKRQARIDQLLSQHSSQIAKEIERSMGIERERFRKDLKAVLATERTESRIDRPSMGIVFWSLVVMCLLIAAALLFVMLL